MVLPPQSNSYQIKRSTQPICIDAALYDFHAVTFISHSQ